MTLAVTQGLAYLLRRSFDFAQDDRFGCQSGQLRHAVIPDQLPLSSRPTTAVIPTVAEGSHDAGSDSRFGMSTQEILRLRSG